VIDAITKLFAPYPHFRVKTFTDHMHFRDAFKEFNPKLIISDVIAIDYDFIETMRYFENENSGCYKIVITGRDLYNDISNMRWLLSLFKLGVYDVIPKTIDDTWLGSLLESANEVKNKIVKTDKLLRSV
jgi:DNA-binding NtrC family response regulator